jgi:hypothetical protein
MSNKTNQTPVFSFRLPVALRENLEIISNETNSSISMTIIDLLQDVVTERVKEIEKKKILKHD